MSALKPKSELRIYKERIFTYYDGTGVQKAVIILV